MINVTTSSEQPFYRSNPRLSIEMDALWGNENDRRERQHGFTAPNVNAYRSQELRRRIHQSHLAYLNMEDTPQKLETKTKLESLILDLLSLVPHNSKFGQQEVADCLNRSIHEHENFSIFKAALAFEALEKFATNILTQPWRKEYHVIRSFSGYYRHTIESPLIGTKNILHAMGYKNQQKDASGILNLESPLDPDKLAKVALDCLVAFVECQVMIQVHDMMKTKNIDATWKEISAVRLKFACGMDDVVRIIVETKMKLARQQMGNSSSPNISAVPATKSHNGWSNGQSEELLSGSLKPKKSGVSPASQSSNSHESDVHSNGSLDLMHFPVSSSSSQRHPSYSQQFVTTEHPSHYLLSPQSPNTPPLNYIAPPPAMFANDPSPTAVSSYPTHMQSGCHQNVDQNGYLLENIAQSANRLALKNGTLATPLDTNHHLTRPNKNSQKMSPDLSIDKGKRRANLYDSVGSSRPAVLATDATTVDLVSPESSSTKLSSIQSRINSLRKNSSSALNTNGLTLHSPSASDQDNRTTKFPFTDQVDGGVTRSSSSQQSSKTSRKWQCTSCTFLNREESGVCEMCSRSRDRGIEAPLTSGGKECPCCTLVNSRGRQTCSACDASLIDSPTYI